MCTLIATAEYCCEVVGALGRSVAKILDAPFGAQVLKSRPCPLHATCTPDPCHTATTSYQALR